MKRAIELDYRINVDVPCPYVVMHDYLGRDQNRGRNPSPGRLGSLVMEGKWTCPVNVFACRSSIV